MNALFFLISIFGAIENSANVSPGNAIKLCEIHLRQYFSGFERNTLINFNRTIDNKYCNLEAYHIDICEKILKISFSCSNCRLFLADCKILCKKCLCSGTPVYSCEICKKLCEMVVENKFNRLCMKKFILNKFTEGMAEYYYKKLGSGFFLNQLLILLSESSFTAAEIKILNEKLFQTFVKFDTLNESEIQVLNACVEYHSELENKDSMSLFNEFLKDSSKCSNAYIPYLAMRFDIKFYNEITSKDLYNLIQAVSSLRSKLYPEICEIFMGDLIVKIGLVGFVMEKDDFFRTIDLYIGIPEYCKFLFCFFAFKDYLNLLTEEKIISILKKIFRIKTIKELCPLLNLRIFKSSIDEEENNLGENLVQLASDIQRLNISSNDLSEFISLFSPDVIEAIKMLLKNFTRFTSVGLVKITSIFFYFLKSDTNLQNIIKDMLLVLYSNPVLPSLTLDNSFDLIDLYFEYGIIFDKVEIVMKFIFDNIQSGVELNEVFDHIFKSSKISTMLEIFPIMCDNTKQLSEARLEQLIEYYINTLPDKTYEFFIKIRAKYPSNISFQIKYIQIMLNRKNIVIFDFFQYMTVGIFIHFSKNQLNELLQFCILYEKYNFISEFVKYLDFEQMTQIKPENLSLIEGYIFKPTSVWKQNMLDYIDTPFLYFVLYFHIDSLIASIEREDDAFLSKVIIESILKNPLLLKCSNYFQKIHSRSDMFDNVYLKNIFLRIFAKFRSCPKACKCFYDTLSLDQKIIFRILLIKKIIDSYKRKIDNKRTLSPNDEATFVKSLLDKCAASADGNQKVNFFLENFDLNLYNLAITKFTESLKEVILSFELDYLIKVYSNKPSAGNSN